MNKKIVGILVLLCSMLGSQLMFAELRDPTRPPANIQNLVSPTSFVLNAIISAHDRKIAVINGLKMRVGDQILGEEIIAIHENTVQLEGPSGKITLFLFGEPVKHFVGHIGCERKWNLCMDVKE